MKISVLLATVSALLVLPLSAQTSTWLDESLPVDKRVDLLIGQMTLDEKVSQMMNDAPAIERLGVPAYNWWNECLHGVARAGLATVYPQAIGLAATFDDEALHTSATYISDEARAKYNEFIRNHSRKIYEGLTFWSPNVNIFRDPRWGRGQETYGEDPYLTARMGIAFVKGLQGTDAKYLKLVATAKHFAVHSGPEYKRHVFNAQPSRYDLWDTYLAAFKEIVTKAKVASVMCAYNRVDGKPCCGSSNLLMKILHGRWGFAGYTVSDCGAIDDFYKTHKVFANAEAASANAVLSGTDLECGNSYQALVDAVRDGDLPEKDLNTSLHRLFYARFRLGMFDWHCPYDTIPYAVVDCDLHRRDALLMAEKSVVLLENKGGLLPLSKHLHKVAVVGPAANDSVSLLGNYNGFPGKRYTVLDGIKAECGSETQVVYEPGVGLTDDKALVSDTTKREAAYKAFARRVGDADVIIFAGGISPSLEGEEMPVHVKGFRQGDRTSLALPEVQTRMMKALAATGKPVIFVMQTGSALSINWEKAHLPAIVNMWYGGQAAGIAVAKVLFGDYNPAGRLPVTFYKSVNDLPAFENYGMKGRIYRYFKSTPLFPFGFGLSYTHFKYSGLTIDRSVSIGKSVCVAVDVTNTGGCDGDEVVQLYVQHGKMVGEIEPNCELKGFRRVHLKKGECKHLVFELCPEDLSRVDELGVRAVYPETIRLSVGGGQPQYSANGLIANGLIVGRKMVIE